jgi:minor extracellular protease Epr
MRSLKSMLVGVVVLGGACDVGEWSGGDVLPVPTEEVGLVAGRYVVVASGLERYGFALESAGQCGADIGIEIPHIFAFSAELSVACVEVFLQIPGIVVELDSTMMVQGDDVLTAPVVNEDNFAAMPRGAYRVGADVLWRDGYFGAGARVALVDTGVDCTHQEFSWLVHEGIVVDATQGYSFGAHCVDENGHGTAVAGLLAAAHDGVGVRGMAPAMTLYSVKAFNANGVGNYSAVAAGIVWAAHVKNADILLLPFGGFYDSAVVSAAISYARNRGTVIVAAVGNSQEIMFPARAEGVVGVGVIDEGDNLWSLSAQGVGVDVVAPGSYEYVPLPGNSYAYMSGTSLAAARVAGGLALVISRLPMLNPAAIDDFLVRTSDDLGGIGWDEEFGYGVMSIPSILRMAEIGWKM